MHRIVAVVSNQGLMTFGVDIQVIDDETDKVISQRPYCITKGEPLECNTYYRAELVQQIVQKALDISMEVYTNTQNLEMAVVEFDYNTVYSPVINYPASHIQYA